jgi:hypothetical protein
MQPMCAHFPRTVPTTGVLVVLLATALASSQPVGAQTFAPYSDFQAMSVARLATLQVKLTYIGDQTASINTVAFTAPGNPVDLTLFTPYRRPGLHYANDDSSPRSFAATTQQLRALLDSVGKLPNVTDGDVDLDGSVSFALLNTAGGTTKVFEAVVNGTSGPALFDKMLSALAGNSDGIRVLTDFGCDVHLLPASTLLSAEELVRVDVGGLRRDHQTSDQFVCKVRVTNTSITTLPAPLSLVVIRHGNAELLGGSGLTCNTYPPGFPYVNLSVGNGLAPGSFAEATLRFANPSGGKLTLRFRAFAGPGIR